MDLTDFLLARVAEDEAAALGSTWAYPANVKRADQREAVEAQTLGMACPTCKAEPGEACVSMTTPRQSPRPADKMHGTRFALGRAEHRRHNGVRNGFGPARVLAECEAKRRAVTYVTDMPGCPHPWVSEDGRLKRMLGGWCFACNDFLKILALPYADHPDYDEEWRP